MIDILVVSCVLITSASLLCLHRKQEDTDNIEKADCEEQNFIVFDDADLPEWEDNDTWAEDDSEQARHDMIMSFTQTCGKRDKQLPIVGLPDKALYNIH